MLCPMCPHHTHTHHNGACLPVGRFDFRNRHSVYHLERLSRSFTLIELLIVIAVIGLLAAMAVAALNTARVKSRDSRRAADIHQITTALELSFNFNDSYPNSGATVCLSTCMSGSPPAWCSALLTQMLNIPNDPLPNQQCYLYNSDGSNFRVAAKLESSSNYDLAQSDGGLYPQFFEGQSTPGQILLTAYKSVWPTTGLAQLDPNYSSLVGWWDFEEGTGGAGATTADFSAGGNNGTLSATPPTWQTQCPSGGCLSYDGANHISTNSFGMSGTVLTLSAWMKVKFDATIIQTIFSDNARAVGSGYLWIYRLNNTNYLAWEWANATQYRNTSATTFFADPYNDTWVHMLIVCDYPGHTTYFYRNGTLINTNDMTGDAPIFPTTARVKYISRFNATTLPLTNGSIDDVRLYNIALTPSQICHLCKEKKSASFCNNCSE